MIIWWTRPLMQQKPSEHSSSWKLCSEWYRTYMSINENKPNCSKDGRFSGAWDCRPWEMPSKGVQKKRSREREVGGIIPTKTELPTQCSLLPGGTDLVTSLYLLWQQNCYRQVYIRLWGTARAINTLRTESSAQDDSDEDRMQKWKDA